mmetsp:Transcript_47710/g.144278  ORF Transcript_47710/g.144278 Transcript_47710/m.144278 type:complete len:130 (-) Transcript_47710:47-436(-)
MARITSWVEDQEDGADDVNWAEVIADVGTWVLYACLKGDSKSGTVPILDSALESAALGLASSVFALLLTESVVVWTDWLAFAESSKEKIKERDMQEWTLTYVRAGLSASALFFVYDFVLRFLEGGPLLG